ncbi:MAG: hypothetical protein FJ398_19740 [Verrucomicrobia bacterium]|nr:hypothetical protein [Verrucomicrobiota bacterium]
MNLTVGRACPQRAESDVFHARRAARRDGLAALAGATPVAVELETATETAPLVLPDLKSATRTASFGATDALAALATDGSLLLSLVYRGSWGPIRVAIELNGFQVAGPADVRMLTGEVPWAANTLERPEAIKPLDKTVGVRDGKIELDVLPFTLLRVRIPAQQ